MTDTSNHDKGAADKTQPDGEAAKGTPEVGPPVEQKSLEDKKLEEEILNLKASTKELEKSVLRKPTFWFSVCSALVAILGIWLQANLSHKEYILAEIKREKALAEMERAQSQADDLSDQIAVLTATIEERKKGKSGLEEEVQELTKIRDSLQSIVDKERSQTRFVPLSDGVDEKEFLRGLLNGWWKSADIAAIRRVEIDGKDGWLLREAPPEVESRE